MAKQIQERLRTALDSRIVDFQYGYRQGRSTAEPIFIARRIQEIAERHGLQLFLLALDYSKAFDSIPHDRLIESLHRLGAPQDMIRLVELLYASPKFRIKIQEGISEEFEQQIGIRQGCPLSPYLYIIAPSCLMTDVLKDWENEPENAPPPGASHPALLFADDTLLLTDTATKMTRLLELIINHSDTYNLKLNRAKCQLLVTNDRGTRVHFPDGTETEKHPSIKYLGATFSATLDVGMIVRQKLTEASATMRLLAPPWTDAHISIAWKLVVFNAVIRSRIFYTLETLELTQSHQRILDTLYFRGLRRILKKRATFVDRKWTHERLLHLANTLNAQVAPATPKHISFGAYYRLKRRKLVAHLLRAPSANPCRRAILTPENVDLVDNLRKKRVGRPRFTWLQESLKETWAVLAPGEAYDPARDFPVLLELALRRAPPF